MSTQELFEKAAEILMEDGHCKFAAEDEQGRHCAMGALHKAAGWSGRLGTICGEDYDTKPVFAAAKIAHAKLALTLDPYDRSESVGLVDWNNADERTGEDVILLFKECAHEAQ